MPSNYGTQGSSYQAELWLVSVTPDPANNGSYVRVIGRTNKLSGSGFQGNSTPAIAWSVSCDGQTQSGSVNSYNFNGVSSIQWFDITFWVAHNPAGDKKIDISMYVDVRVSANYSSFNDGGASFSQYDLGTLKVIPGTPTGVAGAYVSDTAIGVSWAQSSASNGQPTSNTIRRKVNDGAWADAANIAPTTSATLAAAANQKIVYGVKAGNTAGDSGWSADSAPVFTTPAAPTNVTATKVGSDIQLALTPNVAFAEHQHVVEHGVDVAGTVTWDGAALATLTAGTSTYTHAAPNPAQRHVYRVRARNTDVGALSSPTVQSNVVQLLTAPAKPTVPAPSAFADKAAAFRFAWVHNAIDSSAQTKRQVRYSLDGGTTWTTGAKTASTALFLDFVANTWVANNAVTFQVRTKGAYDSGSDGDASYSPWSDSVTVTFKTRPVASITSPANGSTVAQAALIVVLGFTQAEAAAFVNATIGLYQGATLVEEITSTTLAGTAFATRLADGVSYSVKATVRDSNGIVSSQVTSAFSVDYTEPVVAVVAATYLPGSGIAQLNVTIPAAGGGFVAATRVTIDRIINGVTENLYKLYPTAPSLTFLDTTPTIHGTNLYRVTTVSADGATSQVTATVTTAEDRWAFLSTGAGFTQIVQFGDNLKLNAAPTADSDLFKAAGRVRPIGLYGATGDLSVSGTATLVEGFGSTPEEIEALLLTPMRACYRDPSGRRMFGRVTGQISRDNAAVAAFSYSVTETSS